MRYLHLTGVESSYKANNYGDVFYMLARIADPVCAVELGTYHGYSGLHIAAALADNSGRGSLDLIDLWDGYPYRHCSQAETEGNFRRNGLLHLVQMCQEDAESANDHYGQYVDFLHVDISNCGDVLDRVLKRWFPKLSDNATVIVEGGSVERDNIEWMRKFERRPIRDWLQSEWVNKRFDFVTLQPFPSLTIMRRK